MLSKKELRDRGWPTEMIKKMLGAPDAIVEHSMSLTGGPKKHLYSKARVEEAELSPEFFDQTSEILARRMELKSKVYGARSGRKSRGRSKVA